MDPILHAVIALGCMIGCFYLGKFLAARECVEPVVGSLLEKLESEGYIYTDIDKYGDKELIPVSEVVAKALTNARKHVSKKA